MLSREQIFEIESITIELDHLSTVLGVNIDTYTDMHDKGYECSYICDLIRQKIDLIKNMFTTQSGNK